MWMQLLIFKKPQQQQQQKKKHKTKQNNISGVILGYNVQMTFIAG